MNQIQYEDWCESIININEVMDEVEDKRNSTLKWFCTELKEIFSLCGDVKKVTTTKDGSIIDILFCTNNFVYKAEAFDKVYCPMRICYQQYGTDTGLRVRLYPDITKSED